MGDRGSIVMHYGKHGEKAPDIYFYSHWSGSELPEILSAALVRGKGRWSDPAYLARIIFSEMIQGSVLNDTGYGIAPFECDNSHPLVIVNTGDRTVSIDGRYRSFESHIAAFPPDGK